MPQSCQSRSISGLAHLETLLTALRGKEGSTCLSPFAFPDEEKEVKDRKSSLEVWIQIHVLSVVWSDILHLLMTWEGHNKVSMCYIYCLHLINLLFISPTSLLEMTKLRLCNCIKATADNSVVFSNSISTEKHILMQFKVQ